jgi:branched-chain amino acid aminotransferase
MLNDLGNVACSTIGNVFFSRSKTLITPSKDQGILPGVMRDVTLRYATNLGWQCEERAISTEEISQFDGAFLSNSLRLVRPVVALESQMFSRKFDDLLAVLMQNIHDQSDFEMRSN